MDDEAILVDVDTGDYFSMNRTGTEIWTLLQKHVSEREIASTISAKYGVDEQKALADIAALTAELRDARMWGLE